MTEPDLTYILLDNLGGISSFTENLAKYSGDDALIQQAILLDIKENVGARHTVDLGEIFVSKFSFSNKENWYSIYKNLLSMLGTGKGVIISNDVYELVMLSYYNTKKKVIQIVHDGYNVKLSIQFESEIDAFICHSFFFYEMLQQLLPNRRDDIYHISYGIPITISKSRLHENKTPLKLLFLGRHDQAKGIFDLFLINEILKQMKIPVEWLIMGRGPETNKLKKQWEGEGNISFYAPENNYEILQVCGTQDILILPTKFEGFPVAMVEAMSMGCVPIVSDLPGGIRELSVNENVILCELDNNLAFAEGIKRLYHDPLLLNKMSKNCKDYIAQNHNAILQSPKFHTLFKKIANLPALPLHHSVKKRLGSRADQSWLPNFFTKIVRGLKL